MRYRTMRIALPVLLSLLFPGLLLAQPAQLNRVLRAFDFEERRLGNVEELPMHWDKVEGSGMPHYVNGRLSTDRARSGQYSFRFDLNGGSLLYRFGSGRIPIEPGAHYRVEGYVQTVIMQRARARLTAYLTDIDHRPIPGTVRHSEPYAATRDGEGWRRLSIDLSADHPEARYIVLEAGLLQPEHYAPASLGTRTLHTQDIRGTAWFDDITVSQVPRMLLSTDRPGNVFARGEPVNLQVLVNDRSTNDLAAQLTLRNAAGQLVHQQSGTLEMSGVANLPGTMRASLPLPDLRPGWYHLRLAMTSHGHLVGEQSLNLVRLADDNHHTQPDSRFGLIATDLPFAAWQYLPDVLGFFGAGRIKLAVWSSEGDAQELGSAGFDELLERLAGLGIRPTACLIDLPPNIRQRVVPPQRPGSLSGITSESAASVWVHLLQADPEAWRPQLAYMLARHANHLDRWQFGADGDERFVTDPRLRKVYQQIHTQFSQLMSEPDLAMPWPAWHDLGSGISGGRNADQPLPAAVALSVPASVLPSQLPLYMQDLPQHAAGRLSLTLELLDADQYGRDVQIRDLAQRVIYALAGGAERIDLPLPLRVQHDQGEPSLQPQELLPVIRTLITILSGTHFRGRVPIGEGVEAFLFDRHGQGILAMWDRGNQPGVKQLTVNLGQRPMRVDLWGNITPLVQHDAARAGGQVQLEVGPMPVFLVDVDGQLAQFRASVGFDRPLIESSFQPHTRKVRFTNPYRQAIGGTMRLRAPAGWTINPPTFSFTLNPGETFERDVTIEFPYNSFAGPRTIEAEFAIQGERNDSFTVPLVLNLGLSDVGMQTLALRDGSEVIVQQIISNYGNTPIDYTAFAIFPGHARQERLVTNLAPGRTTMRLYRFTDVTITPDSKVRSGIKELIGTRILNDEVPVQ